MRLDKFLANAGYGTRKEVKKLIKNKRVLVNQEVVTKDDFAIDEYQDKIYLDDELIEYHQYHYFMLHKPQGYVSATEDNFYPTVLDLLSDSDFRYKLFPVGRLDMDSTGLIFLTDHGTLGHRLLSPKYHVLKKYRVTTDYPIKEELVEHFQEGILLDGELTLPSELIIEEPRKAIVVLHQGKYHQIKRMFKNFGITVITLHRFEFGPLELGDLKEGEYRQLTEEEIEKLKEI